MRSSLESVVVDELGREGTCRDAVDGATGAQGLSEHVVAYSCRRVVVGRYPDDPGSAAGPDRITEQKGRPVDRRHGEQSLGNVWRYAFGTMYLANDGADE